MEIFDEVKSNLFKAIEQIIKICFQNGEITLREIQKILQEFDCNYPSIEKRILAKDKNAQRNFYILKEIKQKPNVYKLRVNSFIAPFITDSELLWLKTIIDDFRSRLFLDNALAEKILKAMPLFSFELDNNAIIYKNYAEVLSQEDVEHLKEKLSIVIPAILDEKIIRYSYITRGGKELNNMHGIPVKIQYSLKDDILYAIIYSIEKKNFAKCIIQNLYDLRVVNSFDDYDKIIKDYEEYLKAEKCQEPIILEVSNTRNALERAFCLFSPFERSARYIEEKDKHEMKIYYYSFEEAEIISRILYVGKDAVVLSPKRIRDEIIFRVKKALQLYGINE